MERGAGIAIPGGDRGPGAGATAAEPVPQDTRIYGSRCRSRGRSQAPVESTQQLFRGVDRDRPGKTANAAKPYGNREVVRRAGGDLDAERRGRKAHDLVLVQDGVGTLVTRHSRRYSEKMDMG